MKKSDGGRTAAFLKVAEIFRRRHSGDWCEADELLGGLTPRGKQPPSIKTLAAVNDELDRKKRREAYDQAVPHRIAERVNAGHLAEDEAADPRYWECRTAGLNPVDVVVRQWFFALAPDDREDLVRLAVRTMTPFYRCDWRSAVACSELVPLDELHNARRRDRAA